MVYQRLKAALVLGLGLWLNGFSATAAPSLAVISEDEAGAGAADLLTAEFSKAEGITVLERAALAKIVAEQNLSLALSKDVLRVGQLAGAEVLLFLDHFTRSRGQGERPAEFLGLRLISVRAGVVLHTADYSWPVADITEWATTTVKHLQPFLARASLPPEATVKLSLLNLKSPTDSRESRLLDGELNALLLKRLARETNLFVLERQKLGATILERELNSETSPFWSGSYLIEGTVNKLGFAAGSVQVEARVLAPGASSAKVIELSAKRDELPGLIERLVREILKAAEVRSATEWNPAAEAARYFEEANWSLRWGLWSEAQAAADAAWVLGKQEEATARLRVLAYARASDSDIRVSFIYPQRRRQNFEKPPSLSALASAIIALSLYYEQSVPRKLADVSMNKVWLATGLEALNFASRLLHHYYYMPEARAGREGSLAELRALCRDVGNWMAQVPSIRAPFYLEGELMNFDQINSALEKEHLFKTMAAYGGLWQETVRDGIELQRRVMTAPAFGVIRDQYFQENYALLTLAGWNWDERQKVLPAWKSLLTEFQSSTSVVTRIDAGMLEASLINSGPERYARMREVIDLISTNAETLGKYPAPLHYEFDVGRLLEVGLNIVTDERDKLQQDIYRIHNRKFEEIKDAQWKYFNVRKQRSESANLFPAQKDFLERRSIEFREFQRLFPPFTAFAEEQVRSLLPLLKDYRGALTNSLSTVDRSERGKTQAALFQAAALEKRLNEMIGIKPLPVQVAVPPSTNRVTNRAGVHRPFGPRVTNLPPHLRPRGVPHMAEAAPFVPAKILTNVLTINNFRAVPTNILNRAPGQDVRVTGALEAEGKIWLRMKYAVLQERAGVLGNLENRGMLAGFSASEGLVETVPLPAGRFGEDFHFGFQEQLDADFQFWNGDVYAAGGPQLQKYDRTAKSWASLPIPLPRKARLYLIHNKLFALTPESLLEIDQGGASVKTLASSRRQPPVSALDTVTNLAAGFLAPAENGFRVWIPPSVYQYTNGTFSLLHTFAGWGKAVTSGDNLLFFEAQNHLSSPLAYRLDSTENSPIALFAQPPHGMPAFRRPNMVRGAATNLLWEGMEQFSLHGDSAAANVGDLFLRGGPIAAPGATNSAHPALEMKTYLFLLSKKYSAPVVFDLEHAPGVPSVFEKGGSFNWSPFLLTTEEHLVFIHTETPGVWFVPLAEIYQVATKAEAPKL